jgi:tetratricopeptide (TPR) repeat protein
LAALVSVPLYFNIYSSRVFEPDKLIVLRSIVLLMCFAYVVKVLEARREGNTRDRAQEPEPHPRQSSSLLSILRSANPLALPALALAFVYILASIISISPVASFWGSYQRLQGTYTNLTYIVLFFLIAHNLRSREQIDRFVKVALLTSVPVSLYGVAQNQHLDPLPWGGDVTFRVASSMGNAIFVAAYLIMIVPLAMARLFDAAWQFRRLDVNPDTRPKPTYAWHIAAFCGLLLLQNLALALFLGASVTSPNLWWGALPVVGLFLVTSVAITIPARSQFVLIAEIIGYSLLLLIQLAAIALSGSRGPWIGLIVGVSVFVIAMAIRCNSKTILRLSSAVAGIVVAFLILMNVPNTPLAPLKGVPYLGRLGQLTEIEGGTGKVRVLIWQGAVDLITTFPSIGFEDDNSRFLRPLLGYGPEAMYVAFNKVYPPDLAHYEARNASPDRAHMDVLDHLVMTGILGTAAFLAVLLTGLISAWRALRRTQSLVLQALLIGIISAVVAHFVESLVGIAIASTLTYMWAFFGLVMAVRHIQFSETASAVQSSNVFAATISAVPAGATSSRLAAGSRRVGAAKPGSETKARVARRNHIISHTAYGASERSSLVHLVGDLAYILAYFLATLLFLLLLSRERASVDIRWYYVGGFVWFAFGILAAALSLGKLPVGRSWRSSNWWIYPLLGLVTSMLIVTNLNTIIADISYKRGFSFDAQRQFDQAIPAYQDALNLAPNQDFYFLFLGRAFLELAKGVQKPNVTPAFTASGDVVRGIQLTQVARLGKDDLLELSRASLEEARALNPLNTDHYANLGRLYRYWGELGDRQKLEVSNRYYTQALTLSPQAAHLWAEWSELLLAKGQVDQAIEKATTGVKIDSIYPTNHVYLGDSFLTAGKPNEALESHLRALELDPLTLSDPRFENRVSAYEKAGLLDKLEAGYRVAAQSERGRGSPSVRSAYGYLLSRMGRSSEAMQEFRAWVQLSPRDWLARRNLALSFDSLGMANEAIAEAMEAKRLAPADQQAALQNFIADLQLRKQ